MLECCWLRFSVLVTIAFPSCTRASVARGFRLIAFLSPDLAGQAARSDLAVSLSCTLWLVVNDGLDENRGRHIDKFCSIVISGDAEDLYEIWPALIVEANSERDVEVILLILSRCTLWPITTLLTQNSRALL